MKNIILALAASLLTGAASLSAASICPTTSYTNTDCGFLITIGATGTASVMPVTGATAFNGPLTFNDGTMDPGNDGSLIGVINNDPYALTSLTIEGTGANAGIFDLSYNGICVYSKAAYCTLAQSGYEGPTSTFTNLVSTVLFEDTEGTINFAPALGKGSSTYFSIQDAPSDITANGGLSVISATFAPEPGAVSLLGLGLMTVFFLRRKPKQTV